MNRSIMQAALDMALEYTHERKQFGKQIGTFQLMQGKLAGTSCRSKDVFLGGADALKRRYVHQAECLSCVCIRRCSRLRCRDDFSQSEWTVPIDTNRSWQPSLAVSLIFDFCHSETGIKLCYCCTHLVRYCTENLARTHSQAVLRK